jgi:hypothetical protein
LLLATAGHPLLVLVLSIVRKTGAAWWLGMGLRARISIVMVVLAPIIILPVQQVTLLPEGSLRIGLLLAIVRFSRKRHSGHGRQQRSRH